MPTPPILPQSFYLRPPDIVAPGLLGKMLCTNGIRLRITEVEAYGGPEDSASHCRFGLTPRNSPMWGPGGHCYAYLCYGIHWMLNAVTGKPGEGAAVLIRSCDVVDGLDEVMQRRKTMRTTALCNGPGKVGQALAICKAISGHPLFELGGLELRDGSPPAAIERAVRVGIGYAAEKDRNALMRFLGTGISA